MTDKNENKQGIIKAEGSEKRASFDAISWSIDGTKTMRKARAFLKAVKSGDILLVEHMVSENNKLSEADAFISKKIGKEATYAALKESKINLLYMLIDNDFIEKYSAYGEFYAELGERKNKDILKDLVDRKIIDINVREERILTEAAWRCNVDMCVFILELGSDYLHAPRRINRSSRASRALQEAVAEFKKRKEKKLIAIEKHEDVKDVKLLEKTSEEQVTENTEWEALNDNIIVQYETIKATNTTLQTIFNFKARDVTTVYSIDSQAPASVVIRNFKDIESDDVLFEAWHKLKALNKTPIDFKGNDNFTVYKPVQKQNIKIER